MLRGIKNSIIAVIFLTATVLVPVQVSAVDVFDESCKDVQDSVICNNKAEKIETPINNIVNTLLFVVGLLSVVMLIYGGIRYTTSGGNANSVTAAKNTIMYAIIGLVVAFIAFAVVNWVLASLT